ncbi:hypothetical protein KIPB_008383 [Kipferlia bialata]|uniref:Uncharacterized protein n=1 Tax=Kipferlia bialata TaxID=797122 RepID=A0A9K3D1M1_9EUKA|nr:hypothetical protein KIPB_008383 [Kipferlia bialata]|eukprot:g8383.t1
MSTDQRPFAQTEMSQKVLKPSQNPPRGYSSLRSNGSYAAIHAAASPYRPPSRNPLAVDTQDRPFSVKQVPGHRNQEAKESAPHQRHSVGPMKPANDAAGVTTAQMSRQRLAKKRIEPVRAVERDVRTLSGRKHDPNRSYHADIYRASGVSSVVPEERNVRGIDTRSSRRYTQQTTSEWGFAPESYKIAPQPKRTGPVEVVPPQLRAQTDRKCSVRPMSAQSRSNPNFGAFRDHSDIIGHRIWGGGDARVEPKPHARMNAPTGGAIYV